MIFKLTTAGGAYSPEDAEKLRKLGIGFQSELMEIFDSPHVIKSNDDEGDSTIEIDTLDDLLKFMDEWGQVILFPKDERETYPELRIYDDYNE